VLTKETSVRLGIDLQNASQASIVIRKAQDTKLIRPAVSNHPKNGLCPVLGVTALRVLDQFLILARKSVAQINKMDVRLQHGQSTDNNVIFAGFAGHKLLRRDIESSSRLRQKCVNRVIKRAALIVALKLLEVMRARFGFSNCISYFTFFHRHGAAALGG
jgi:hypothetical protein